MVGFESGIARQTNKRLDVVNPILAKKAPSVCLAKLPGDELQCQNAPAQAKFPCAWREMQLRVARVA